jgi:hypothetical protein
MYSLLSLEKGVGRKQQFGFFFFWFFFLIFFFNEFSSKKSRTQTFVFDPRLEKYVRQNFSFCLFWGCALAKSLRLHFGNKKKHRSAQISIFNI